MLIVACPPWCRSCRGALAAVVGASAVAVVDAVVSAVAVPVYCVANRSYCCPNAFSIAATIVANSLTRHHHHRHDFW